MTRIRIRYHARDPAQDCTNEANYVILGIRHPQVDAPEAVLAVPNECQPGGTVSSGIFWPVVLRKDTAHDIFIYVDTEGMRDLLGDAHITELMIAAFHLDDGRNEFGGWTLGSGFAATPGRGEQKPILAFNQRLVKPKERGRLEYCR
jgi:hypothetical protein